MTATTHPSSRRAAATWVGATGAFLLVAAAAVFVARRWDTLPETAKLALVGGLTGAFLLGGRSLRRTLPATGDVLFHLGAFLIPIDLLGACLRMDVDWRVTLLVEGLVCAPAFGLLAQTTGSVVMGRAATVAVVVLAAGVAGVSPLPATLVLAAIAVTGELALGGRLRRPIAVWAAVAGLAPALGAAAGTLLDAADTLLGTGTLTELGLTGRAQQAVAALSGVLAAAVIARQAQRHRDLRLAFLAMASVFVGLGTSATAARVGEDTALLGLAGLFVVIEVVALLTFDDDFWGRPLASVAVVAEAVAVAGTALAGFILLAAPALESLDVQPDATAAAMLGLLALGWLTGDMRRVDPVSASSGRSMVQGAGWLPGTIGATVAVSAAVAVGTASPLATALAMVAIAAAAVFSGRAGGSLVAAAFGPWAVLTAAAYETVVPAVGLAAGLVIAVGAERISDQRYRALIALDATVTAMGASLFLADRMDLSVAICVAAAVGWLMAAALDRSSVRQGDVARIALLGLLALAVVALRPAQALAPLTALTFLYVLEAVRLRRPVVAYGAAAAVQPLVVALALVNGLSLPFAGLALCVCAVVWSGLSAVTEGEWRAPFVASAAGGLGPGLLMATADPHASSSSLLVAGSVGIGAGLVLNRSWLGHLGAGVATVGLAGHLVLAGVTASEPFVGPVALQLLVAGCQAQRRNQASSWLAYAPPVALLGGAALVERLNDGAGWHALVAGAVGVVAVAVGGWRRLAGPMVVGTALLVALTASETLATLAGVPTWAWLALGGSLLLLTAVALERRETSPVEAGRRVVEVLAERFE
jgi:hypothetical protein